MRPGLLLAALLVLPSAVSADIVQLKDGRTLRGKIIAQDKEAISLRASDGDYLIYRSQMLRFFFDDPAVFESQLERERARETQAPGFIPAAENRAVEPERQFTREPASKPPAAEEQPEGNHLFFQLSGGTGTMNALYPEYLKQDKTAEYLQQSLTFTRSVSYPYQESTSKPSTYAAAIYYETARFMSGFEAFTAKNAGGFQMQETLTNSGRYYAGSGSFSSNTVSVFQLRPGILIGSRDWPVQFIAFTGPVLLQMASKANQTETITDAATLAASAVYSPTMSSTARANGYSAGLELRFPLGTLFEVRARGSYASLKGSFKTSELRLPLQDVSAYAAGTAYPSSIEGSAAMHTVLTDVRTSLRIKVTDSVSSFLELQSISMRNNFEGYNVVRAPEVFVAPLANIHADLYRSLSTNRKASVRSYRAGIEFRAF